MAEENASPEAIPPGEEIGEEAVEAGRLLFAAPCDFVLGAASVDGLPRPELPEVAFAGRSNVGKSSLINALTGHTRLARISHTPGRTQQINFFRLDKRLMLVDLPGYGYARASKAKVNVWTRLIEDYLAGRANLRRVCLLIDARRGAMPNDRAVMDLLDTCAVPYQAVFTKADKVKPGALATRVDALGGELAARRAAHPDILATSARTLSGLPQLRATIAALAASSTLG